MCFFEIGDGYKMSRFLPLFTCSLLGWSIWVVQATSGKLCDWFRQRHVWYDDSPTTSVLSAQCNSKHLGTWGGNLSDLNTCATGPPTHWTGFGHLHNHSRVGKYHAFQQLNFCLCLSIFEMDAFRWNLVSLDIISNLFFNFSEVGLFEHGIPLNPLVDNGWRMLGIYRHFQTSEVSFFSQQEGPLLGAPVGSLGGGVFCCVIRSKGKHAISYNTCMSLVCVYIIYI